MSERTTAAAAPQATHLSAQQGGRSEATSAASRSAVSEELSTIRVLVRRDLTRFARERSRIVGALVQPLIFWLMIGFGMSGTFVLPGAPSVGYGQYFFPGVVVMVALFSAIFATMSVIEDRHSGFLQAVLVAPGSRASVVLGKCTGAALVAMLQSALFLLLLPAAGFSPGGVDWGLLLSALFIACLSLCLLGFAVAWVLDSTAGYHVVMSLLLLPMWIVSGAMFPASSAGSALELVQHLNPLSYSVSAVRRALYGGQLPVGTGLPGSSASIELLVVLCFAVVCGALSIVVCYRKR